MAVSYKRRGGPDVLEQLYRTYRTAMYHRALGIVGDRGLAEDAVHEAFVRIAKHLPRFNAMSSDEHRYLCLTVVKNASLNLLRGRNGYASLPDNLPAVSTDIALCLDINDAIDALEDGHRQVVILRLRYGFDTAETARLLGIKQGTVRSRLNRARKLLQEKLRENHLKGVY